MRSFTLIWLLSLHTIVAAQRYEVVIHEIFPDPTPSVGLPSYEWVELHNRSARPVSLQGWRIQDAGGQSAPFPNITLQPDSLLIVCSSSGASNLSAYGRCLGISGFPSLDNEGELLILRNANGQVIHAISYSIDWHGTALKKEGGWSMEMIDAQHPGLFKPNWNSSVDPAGGTPGKRNSIERILEDREPPQRINAFMLDSSKLILQFNEALDSTRVSLESNYFLSDSREVIEAVCQPPLYDRIELRTDWPLRADILYTLSWRGVVDLSDNEQASNETTRIGLPAPADTASVRINELLFDPPAGGADYVELIHLGKRIIDVSRLYLTTRGLNGDLGSIKRVCVEPRYVFPGDHIVLTSDAFGLQKHFFVAVPEWAVQTDALPSLPDTEGSLVLLNTQGNVVDELRYADEWHSPLLNERGGVALERIDPTGPTQDQNNWQSAATTVGYGTPTRRNSQYKRIETIGTLELSSFVISPDQDGRDDVIQLRYRTSHKNTRLRIQIFHSNGVSVRELANLALGGSESVFTWDGLDDRKNRLPAGPYLLFVEIYGPDNKRATEKRRMQLVYAK